MRVIESLTAQELRRDEAWWRIYADSFPANEREPPEVILESLSRGVGMALRARRQGSTSGLASSHLLEDPAAVFLVYLAVAELERGQGTGAALLQDAWQAGADRLRERGLSPLGLVWEVDPGEDDTPVAEERRQRLAFFRRHQGQVLERPYLQPPVDGIAAVPMTLMFRPAAGHATPAPQTMDAIVRAIYFEKYGALNGIERSTLEQLLSRSSPA